MKLPATEYDHIREKIPILCVDGIIMGPSAQILLVQRRNPPMRGEWWVPGGRVFKGETLEAAFHRKMREELGIGVKILAPVGYYEVQHPETSGGIPGGTHAVSVVFCALPLSLEIVLDEQSVAWRFADQLPLTFRVVHFGGWLTP